MTRVQTHRIEAVRAFNRFYTPLIGLLQQGYLDSPYTLPQVRVLFELAAGPVTATELSRRLLLDEGYLSRLLRALGDRGLIERTRASHDARQSPVSLTEQGHAAFADLDRRAQEGVSALLERLSEPDQEQVVRAFRSIERILDTPRERPLIVLRPPHSGELGWIVERHGEIYGREYGWNERFEALVAGVVAGFGREHDPHRERCWIADVDGGRAGSILCVRKDDETAQLRLLLVESWARGMGVGRTLVGECVEFARSAGYRKIVLWTMDVLVSARRIYEAAGFRLVDETPDDDYAAGLRSQNWELDLR